MGKLEQHAVYKPVYKPLPPMLTRYDDPPILAGQGTAALELIEQMDREGVAVDAVVIPVGGGGLLAGMSITLKHLLPKVKVIVRNLSAS